MNKKIKTEAVDELFEAILTLENKDECYAFFEDLATINEILSLAQRYEVARMLTEKQTYMAIAEKTGASDDGCPCFLNHFQNDPRECCRSVPLCRRRM